MTEMKRITTVLRMTALALTWAIGFPSASFAIEQQYDVLMWMVDDPKTSEGQSIIGMSAVPMTSARVVAKSEGQADVCLNLYSQDENNNWVVMDLDNSVDLWDASDHRNLTGGSAVYADLSKLDGDLASYSFAIELGNWKDTDDGSTWLLAATSEVWDYDRLFQSGFIAAQAQVGHPTQLGWTGGGYNIPEPTSGLLLLIGGSLLALRRRRNLVAESDVA